MNFHFINNTIFYSLLSLFHVTGLWLWPDTINVFTKLLPLYFLSYWIFSLHSPFREDFKTKVLVIMALFFGSLGDFLLEMPLNNPLFYGGSAFLIGHLFYIALFSDKNINMDFNNILIIVIAGLFYGLFQVNVLSKSGALETFLSIYFLVLVAMVSVTFLNKNLSYLTRLGACLFLLSDSLIIYHGFVDVVPQRSLWVMSTYYCAQFLLAMVGLQHSFIFSKKPIDGSA